jgi:hypothetical protein
MRQLPILSGQKHTQGFDDDDDDDDEEEDDEGSESDDQLAFMEPPAFVTASDDEEDEGEEKDFEMIQYSPSISASGAGLGFSLGGGALYTHTPPHSGPAARMAGMDILTPIPMAGEPSPYHNHYAPQWSPALGRDPLQDFSVGTKRDALPTMPPCPLVTSSIQTTLLVWWIRHPAPT